MMGERRHTQEEIDHWRARILGTNVPRDLISGLGTNSDQFPAPEDTSRLDDMVVAVVSFLTGLGAGIAIMLLKRYLHG
jgi:hypothetical protein